MLLNLIPARCQQQIPIGAHPAPKLLLWALRRRLKPRTRLNTLLGRNKPSGVRRGKASVFSEGDWVRVLDEARIRATLDDDDRLRGLWFAEQQWPYCGGIFRVSKVVRRMQDDSGRMRAISRTVLIDQTCCGGVEGNTGCGRECPLMFRDEWLEPADPPPGIEPAEMDGQSVTVRSEEDIRATLDRHGRHEGLLFMPEMAQYAGREFRLLGRVETVFELRERLSARLPVYLLEGTFCSGDILGEDGPCHRGCRLLWHADWLDFSTAT